MSRNVLSGFNDAQLRFINQETNIGLVRAASLRRTKPARPSQFHDTGIWDGTKILTDQITVTI